MSSSMHVVGFRPPDEKWRKMKDAYDACKLAGVPLPKEVDSFFEHEVPDESGVEVRLEGKVGVTHYIRDMTEGFEVKIGALDPTITIIRFYMSY